jgi:hypothetical protein
MKRLLAAGSVVFLLSTIASVSAEECTEKLFRTTTTGHVFVRDSSIPELGDAWRDESGMIWGSAIRENDQVIPMSHHEAARRCARIRVNRRDGSIVRASLPSLADFERLAKMMTDNRGYHPQVLPDWAGSWQTYTSTFWYWTADTNPEFPDRAYVYMAAYASSGHDPKFLDQFNAARCVIQKDPAEMDSAVANAPSRMLRGK